MRHPKREISCGRNASACFVRKRSVDCGVVILIYTTVPLNWICCATFTVSRVMLPHARWRCRSIGRRKILTVKVK